MLLSVVSLSPEQVKRRLEQPDTSCGFILVRVSTAFFFPGFIFVFGLIIFFFIIIIYFFCEGCGEVHRRCVSFWLEAASKGPCYAPPVCIFLFIYCVVCDTITGDPSK